MNKLILLLSMTMIATSVNALEGLIRVTDGHSIVRINIGEENQSKRDMGRRIRRLEAAVRDLQDMVYDLQTTAPVPSEILFECTARTCRKSSSIHGTSGNNCDFFRLWKNETIKIWAEKGSVATQLAEESLKADRDVSKVQNVPSCLPANN